MHCQLVTTMSQYEVKQQAFNTFKQWAKQIGFIIENETIEKDMNSKIQFDLSIYLKRGYKYPFHIIFYNIPKDLFTIRAKIALTTLDEDSLNTMPKGTKEQVYMDIRKYIFPLQINIYTASGIELIKWLTIDSACNNKQFFMDQLFNFRNAMELVRIRFDELYYYLWPHGKSENEYGI